MVESQPAIAMRADNHTKQVFRDDRPAAGEVHDELGQHIIGASARRFAVKRARRNSLDRRHTFEDLETV